MTQIQCTKIWVIFQPLFVYNSVYISPTYMIDPLFFKWDDSLCNENNFR